MEKTEQLAGDCSDRTVATAGRHSQKACRGTKGAVPAVHMPKNVDHWLHPTHSGEKLVAPRVIVRAGSLIEDAIRRAVGDQDVGIIGDSGVNFDAILI
jgi:hypothetical protein